MDRRDIQNGIFRSWQFVESMDLGETFASGAPLEVRPEFRDLVLRSETDYVTIYLAGMNWSFYNFVLFDFSFFQFSWSSDQSVRYAYYPNPFSSKVEDLKRRKELVEAGMITEEENLVILREEGIDPRTPLIRYEYAPEQYKELLHPCSHFHIGHHDDNRWALNRILSPLAFTLLILKHYYGPTWKESGTDESDPNGNKYETGLIEAKVECRLIGDDRFSAIEARSFFFS
jgi:hypothetical protein